ADRLRPIALGHLGRCCDSRSAGCRRTGPFSCEVSAAVTGSQSMLARRVIGRWISGELAMVLLVISAVVGVYWSSGWGIASLWSYDGFKHCRLVPAVSLVLLWQKRSLFARHEMRGSWIGCVLLSASIWAWLVARLTLIQIGEQLAFLCILHGAVLAFF